VAERAAEVQEQVRAARVRVLAVRVAPVPAAHLEPLVPAARLELPASAAQLAEAEPVTAARVVLAAVEVRPEEDTHLTRGSGGRLHRRVATG